MIGTVGTIGTLSDPLEDRVDTPAELERRLDAGEWLLPGEVATLLGRGRNTIVRMLGRGEIAHRLRAGAGRYRECKPEDVRRLLDEQRREHRGTPAGEPESGEASQVQHRGQAPTSGH